jgi:hypothetical protein
MKYHKTLPMHTTNFVERFHRILARANVRHRSHTRRRRYSGWESSTGVPSQAPLRRLLSTIARSPVPTRWGLSVNRCLDPKGWEVAWESRWEVSRHQGVSSAWMGRLAGARMYGSGGYALTNPNLPSINLTTSRLL